MRTKVYSYKTTSVEQMFTLLVALKALGYRADGSNNDDNREMARRWYAEYPMVNVTAGANEFGGNYSRARGELVDSVEQLINKVATFVPPVVEKVVLNDDYTAEVTKDGITVGCQKFTLEKFDELAKAVNQFRK